MHVHLAMIVRDEERILPRLAASVRQHIDSWTIIDTGSVDDTIAVIQREFADIAGEIIQRPWVDYGTNRNQLLDVARDRGDLLLLLDADMEVAFASDWRDRVPHADAMLLRIGGPQEWWMPYLVRGGRPWRYEGVTHEYLTMEDRYERVPFDGIVITHHEDGGARPTKFQRDLDLLLTAHAADPEDPRTLFYLAQTYSGLGGVTEAIHYYRKRILVGGWEEEAYVAMLRIGDLLAGIDQARAMDAWSSAWDYRPTRVEALHRLGRGHNERARHHQARLLLEAGLRRTPSTDILFVERWVEQWGLRFEWAVAAWWTGDRDAAREVFEELSHHPDVTETYREACRRNLAL